MNSETMLPEIHNYKSSLNSYKLSATLSPTNTNRQNVGKVKKKDRKCSRNASNISFQEKKQIVQSKKFFIAPDFDDKNSETVNQKPHKYISQRTLRKHDK